MVEADLRLVVFVEVRTRLFATAVDAIGGVKTTIIHAAGHVFLHVVPLSEGERARRTRRTGPVLLRSTEAGERELMIGVDALSDIGEIAVTAEASTLNVTIAPRLAGHQRYSPAILHETGAHAHRDLVVTIIAHRIADVAATLGIDAAGNDIDRTTYRGSRKLRSTHTALSLHHRSNVREALPVRPIYGTAFHIVHRYTIDHGSHVGVVKTAHPNLGVAPTATLSVSVYTRGVLEHFGELRRTEALFNLEG